MNKLFETIDKKEVNSSERSITAWGSRPVIDRDGEKIHEQAKWKLDNFKLNPVLMLSHDYSRPPVGRILWTKITDEGLRFKAKFADTEIGRELFQLYKEGVMNSFSIGFLPIKWEEPEEYKSNQPRRTYKELELLEISCVSVPSCPLANLIEASEKGLIKTKEFSDYIEFVKSQESENGKQEETIQETEIKEAESGASGSSQEEEIVIEIEDKDIEVKEITCTCPDCGESSVQDGSSCGMCPDCGTQMQEADDADEDDKGCGNKPKKPKKEVESPLGYNITDEEIETLVKQFETMLDTPIVEFDVDVNKKYMFEDCVYKNVKFPTEEELKIKDFDIASVPSIPGSKVMDTFCKFLECRVKNVYQNDMFIPWIMSGAYLAAFKDITSKFTHKDTRNYSRYGDEIPPSYEVIKINSKTEDDFLLNGIDFYTANGNPIICSFSEGQEGIYVSILTSRKNKDLNKSLVSSAHKWVEEKNPLKGEKISLNKEFFDVDIKDDWSTVVLDTQIEKTLKHSQKLIQEKEFNGRGILMLGPPGTGKTKSARVLMSQTNATFIWVSSKDLTNTWWPEKKIALGFELARKLAPSILLLEDIDNWIKHETVDMMKTELDGLKKNKNVITILTTNDPQKLPNALIDRPGRFHDVLNFDHPTKEIRIRMLKDWIDIEDDNLIEQTEGFSGAYMWELIEFAKSIAEDEDISIEEAIAQSLAKINSQKELIANIRKETKNVTIDINPIVIEGDPKEFMEIIEKEIEDHMIEIDIDKLSLQIQKSVQTAIKDSYIDIEDLFNESMLKAKGKMY